jgi:RNA polymerase sigma-70 factor (sigma-E family)
MADATPEAARVFDWCVTRTPSAASKTKGTDALRMAFEAHYAGVARLCLLLCGSREEAEDLAQEAFVRLAPRLEDLDLEAVGPYVRRIAVNLWKNRLRRLALEVKGKVRLGSLRRTIDEPGREEHERVWQAVRRLPKGQRACVVLRYYEDLSEAEAAEVLGRSLGTVKSQTSRGLARLRKELGDEA